MATDQPLLKALGLFSDANRSDLPPGALIQADNIEIRRRGVIEPRRGLDKLAQTFGSGSSRAKRATLFADFLHVAYDTGNLAYYAFGNWSEVPGSGAIRPPTGQAMRFAEAQQDLFLTTDLGVKRIDGLSSTPQLAGGPKTADMYGSAVSTGASGFCSNASRVGYRVVFGSKDGHGRVLLGPPSGRSFGTNSSGGTRNFLVNAPLPSTGITTAQFWRLYRTKQLASTTDDPGDEMGLVYEAYFTDTDISNGYVSVTDSVPDALRGATGYWCPSQEGILQANEPPPLAKDLCAFRGRMLYANTVSLQRLTLNLLGVGSPNGLQVGDTFTVAGLTYTGNTFTDPTTAVNAFKVDTATGSSVDIENTARNLIEVINRAADNALVRAFYLSGPNDIPGQILLEYRTLGALAFYVGCSRAGVWNGPVPKSVTIAVGGLVRAAGVVTATTGTAHGLVTGDVVVLAPGGSVASQDNNYQAGTYLVASTPTSTTFTYADAGTTTASTKAYVAHKNTQVSADDAKKNRFFSSKFQQPDAVPLLNYDDIGSASDDLYRILAVRDSAFALKKDGIYRLSGSPSDQGKPAWAIDGFDLTVKLYGPETAVRLDNRIFCLSNQGVVAISESGVEILSEPIQDELRKLFTADLAAVKAYSHAVAYETERKFILWTISAAGDTYAKQAFVYNLNTGTWTKRTDGATCGIVGADDKLYTGDPAANTLRAERKTFTDADGQEDGVPVSVTVKWVLTGGAPTLQKQFSNVAAVFDGTAPSSVAFAFTSNASKAAESCVATSTDAGEASTRVPDSKQRCAKLYVTLTHAVVGERPIINGLDVQFRVYGERVSR